VHIERTPKLSAAKGVTLILFKRALGFSMSNSRGRILLRPKVWKVKMFMPSLVAVP
jgi:hypothetical protein